MKKLSLSEIICYGISLAIAVTGLVFLFIGLFASFAGPSGNDLEAFFIPGYICFPVGAVLLTIFLLVFAKTNDKAAEVAARRAARLGKAEIKDAKVEEIKPAE